jgi:DNA mismatch repair protein MutL
VGKIRKLDPLVQSQIAAGEVVERPASVVKELVENSLDAGARRITIEFEDSGFSLIRVSDDGSGMAAEDAPLALERFATSKLREQSDLSSIGTLGFRGEALPSIAAVSRTTLETRAPGDDAGTSVLAEEGRIVAVTEKGLPVGTTVTVRDLFYNTPARLKFVKSRTTEKQAIVDVVTRLALSWPEVAFTLRTGGNVILQTFGKGLASAVSDIFGPKDASCMVPVSSRGVSGYVGLPSLYRRTRDRQIFSVNSRPVRNTALGWALDQAFAGLLPPKTYAVAILNLKTEADEVDVNVHPTKAEVKFQNDRDTRSAVIGAVTEALARSGFALQAKDSPRLWEPPSGIGRTGRVRDTSGDVHWELIRDSELSAPRAAQTPAAPGLAFESGALDLRGLHLKGGDESTWEYLGSLGDTYLIAKTPSSLLLVDKHALMESLTFAALNAGSGGSQELLMAEIVRLDPNESLVYEESADALSAVGFASRMVGERTIMVTAVPMVLGRAVAPGAIREVLSRMSLEDARDAVRAVEAARLETAACHASVRAKEPLSADEARALLKELEQNPGARACPHGRPTVREITMKEMAGFFGRS